MSVELLVVEDDRNTREVLSELLATEGYQVAAAANGREALDRLNGGLRPRLILLDLTMPVMNGWEFRDRQLADPDLSRIPVIVTTAMPPETNGLFNGVTIVRKPIDVDQLLLSIRSHLDDSHPH